MQLYRISLTLKPRSKQEVCNGNWTFHAKAKLITNSNLAWKKLRKASPKDNTDE